MIIVQKPADLKFAGFFYHKTNIKQKTTSGMKWFKVRLEGLEPPTYWFVASHSIQLSYRRIYIKIMRYWGFEPQTL